MYRSWAWWLCLCIVRVHGGYILFLKMLVVYHSCAWWLYIDLVHGGYVLFLCILLMYHFCVWYLCIVSK